MNIYISNLSYGVDDADLNTLFAEYGEVTSAKVIMDRETGRSRGFGFVEIADEAMGQKAIDELNGAEYDGKVITVNVAKPREDRSNGGGRGGYNRGGRASFLVFKYLITRVINRQEGSLPILDGVFSRLFRCVFLPCGERFPTLRRFE